jgi:hypothetical protein
MADLHRNVDANCVLDFNCDGFSYEAAEARPFYFDFVLAWNEVDELVVTGFISNAVLRLAVSTLVRVTFACRTAMSL